MKRFALALALFSLVATAASAQDEDARRERARQLYDEGAKRFEQHQYELAVDAFKSAYALSGRTNLLFNIAVAYEEWSGHCDDAREFYERYLRLKPDATDRGDVETRLARIQQICPSAPVAPVVTTVVPVAPPPPPPPVSRRKLNVTPLIVAALGLVVAGGGAVTRGITAVKYGDLTQVCPCAPSAWQGWQVAEYASYVMLAVGGVALASGLTWIVVHPTIAGASVVVGGAF